MSLLKSASGLTNAAVAVKAAPGKVFGWYLDNTENSATTFFQLFNKKSSDITVGTDAPLFSLAVPGGGAANVLGPASDAIPFNEAIAIAATTGFSNGSAPADAVTFSIFGT
jgi:hypothetical protein